jgi:hypothetical protein
MMLRNNNNMQNEKRNVIEVNYKLCCVTCLIYLFFLFVAQKRVG